MQTEPAPGLGRKGSPAGRTPAVAPLQTEPAPGHGRPAAARGATNLFARGRARLRPHGDTAAADAAQAQEPVQAPQRVAGRYRLLRQVHKGRMSTVWFAVDESPRALGKSAEVAVKLMPMEFAPAHDDATLGKLARASVHPGLVTLLEHGREGDLAFQVSAWIDGQTLESLLREHPGTLALAARIPGWMKQLAEALDALHRAGFVHGDVKPENVLIAGDKACLVDLLGVRIGQPWSSRSGLTRVFASPEALRGAAADPRDDVYSAAVLAFRMLAGHLPEAPDASGDSPPPPRPAYIMPAQWRVLHRALHPDRAQRPTAVTRLVQELWPEPEALDPIMVIPPRPQPQAKASRVPRRIDGRWLTGAAAALVAIAVIGGVAPNIEWPAPATVPESAAPVTAGITDPAPLPEISPSPVIEAADTQAGAISAPVVPDVPTDRVVAPLWPAGATAAADAPVADAAAGDVALAEVMVADVPAAAQAPAAAESTAAEGPVASAQTQITADPADRQAARQPEAAPTLAEAAPPADAVALAPATSEIASGDLAPAEPAVTEEAVAGTTDPESAVAALHRPAVDAGIVSDLLYPLGILARSEGADSSEAPPPATAFSTAAAGPSQPDAASATEPKAVSQSASASQPAATSQSAPASQSVAASQPAPATQPVPASQPLPATQPPPVSQAPVVATRPAPASQPAPSAASRPAPAAPAPAAAASHPAPAAATPAAAASRPAPAAAAPAVANRPEPVSRPAPASTPATAAVNRPEPVNRPAPAANRPEPVSRPAPAVNRPEPVSRPAPVMRPEPAARPQVNRPEVNRPQVTRPEPVNRPSRPEVPTRRPGG